MAMKSGMAELAIEDAVSTLCFIVGKRGSTKK